MRKNRVLSVAALVCAICLLLTGCLSRGGSWIFEREEPGATEAPKSTVGRWQNAREEDIPSFSEMEYVRPDMAAYAALVEEGCAAAENAASADDILESCMEIYDFYDEFYTMQSLSDIRYSLDLRDTYYQEEYQYCSEQGAVVEQGLESYYQALARSPVVEELETENYFGEGFFDAYRGDGLWTEELLALSTQESTLIAEVYRVMNELSQYEYYSEAYFDAGLEPMGQLLVELVKVRQKIAQEAGYDSYVDFAYDYLFERDYTPEQADKYLRQIQEELIPLYRQVSVADFWQSAYAYPVGATSCRKYMSGVMKEMGGKLSKAYDVMNEKGLCDLEPSTNKYTGSFEIYLSSFEVPFLFMNPSGNQGDYLTYAHEFGHFAKDYYCHGAQVTTDVSEIFSQGMEYLSLCYARDGSVDLAALRQLKLADSLNTYVEQAAFARFENEIYTLPEEELTVENLGRIYEEICLDYGFDSWRWDSRDWITISHFFNAPYYVISYVVSNDAAMQLYEMEYAEEGSGLERYEELVGGCPYQFMAFIDEAGLESPFAEGRLQDVKEILETVLN